MAHKHKWTLVEGDYDYVLLVCLECNQVRKCYPDGYKDWDRTKGVYKEESQ